MKLYQLLSLHVWLLLTVFVSAQERGFQQVNLEIDGQPTTLYTGSHALLIGISNYTSDWPDLPGVKDDIRTVKAALEKNDFNVTVIEDSDDREIEIALNDFIEEYGVDPDNRLLIYYAGHGHTMKAQDGRQMGYIVPANSPLPSVNSSQFHRKAISMRKFDGWAREILSKHALFLFDACFSGSLFNLSRAVPAAISYNTSKPVRQFITSGSAEEQVPDHSLFREYFVKAITTSDADANNDGYLTGSELSSYLFDKVTNYSYDQQHPQAGKIRDQYLDKGDFIFVLDSRKKENTHATHISIIEENIAHYGSIELTTEISGSLFLDGTWLKNVSRDTHVTLSDVPTGSHNLKITGDENWQEGINVNEDITTRITAKSAKHNVKQFDWEPDMVFVKGGTFTMGCTREQTDCKDDEKPRHQVILDDFYIGKYEVTQKLWLEVIGNNPSYFSACNDCPVEQVNWSDVQEFIKKLNQKTGKKYRMPTEAEWEFAARGGISETSTTFAGSNNIDEVAWYEKNSDGKTHPVGQKKPNELGLYDMSGNVYEWCSDYYGKYSSNDQNNPKGPTSGSSRILQGGGWNRSIESCRIAHRGDSEVYRRYYSFGFRLALIP
nr:SUMF1/EgtB/PvdO family nonheme iron enzyme [Bacteroidota bacterium]